MCDTASFWNILIAEMPVELPCTALACQHGDGGGPYKTPALEVEYAVKMLDRHRADVHGVQGDRDSGGAGGGAKIQLSKIPRPDISGGSSQEDFKYFLRQWNQYVRASNETNDTKLRDQLLHCPDAALKKAVDRALGDRADTINVADLLKEIETLAVIRQSNHVNTLALMKAKQERDEPVRQFAACLRGLAAVCDLTASCTCGLKVSEVNKWVLMSLIGGLNDEDTKQAVLSKVDEMNLDDTVVFVEARETGKHSVKILSGGLASGQVNRVQEQTADQEKCRFCGRRGHGKNPNPDLRKASCPAHGQKCKNCGFSGHFRDQCKKKPSETKSEDPKKTVAKNNNVSINRMQMTRSSGKILGVKKSSESLMRKQQNMTKLRHKVWNEDTQTYVKSELPEEPDLKIRMCVDFLAYKKHNPPLKCTVKREWKDNLVNNQQKDIVLKTSTADTGAQCFLLGRDHLPGLGLDVDNLVRSDINLNCANSTMAGNLGVFFAKIRGEHFVTEDSVEARAMVYVIEGNIVLVSRSVLEMLGCIPKHFPRVGEFLEPGNKALNGKLFSINPNPIGMYSDGTPIPGFEPKNYTANNEAVSVVQKNDTDIKKILTPDKMLGERYPASQQPEAKTAVRQPPGECDPESDLPCSCPRREFVDPPDKLPMPATASNRKALEEFIREHYRSSAFNTCKRQHWPVTTGPPMRIHTPEDAVRTYCRGATRVPLHFREEVKAGLEADVKKGVLEKVPMGEPDTWCSRMVIQPKKNGRARRTVDLSGLSKAGRHESHHTRSAAEIAKSVPAGKLKSTLDCVDGYHGVELARKDRHKTTFNTEWGMFRYLRVPQGYLSSGDSYTKHTDAILEACPGTPATNDFEKIIDDVIQWSDTLEEAFFRICSMLSHCNQNGMVFSPEKFEFAKESVEFAGFQITMEGIKPTDKYVAAIKNFPTPTNISEVRSWFGLINQVAYSFIKTEHMAPFRHLLSQSTVFEWNEDLEAAFKKSKEKIAELIKDGVASFDMELVTCLSPDYSKLGMGWILQQKTCACPKIIPTCCEESWRLVLAGGHFCNKAEENYSPIEGEATAVAKGLQDTKYYTMGCKNLYVATDHSSLVTVLGDQSLVDVQNPRLARIKERTLWWQFKIIHTPGKQQLAADALSRRKSTLPAALYKLTIDTTSVDDEDVIDDVQIRFTSLYPVAMLEEEEVCHTANTHHTSPVTADINSVMRLDEIYVITWEKLYEAVQEDPVMVKLIEVVLRGFPQSSYDIDEELKPYHKFRHDLHIAGGIVCYKDRAVIPTGLRPQVLDTIHAAHQGVSGMISRVEDTVYWPGISSDIIRTRGSCLTCVRDAPSQPAGTPIAPPTPSFPFQYVVGDYFSLAGVNYLVLGDRFSGWLSIYSAGHGEFDAKALVKKTREYFTTFNIAEEIATDGGPQMTSTVFQTSLKAWGVRHRLSSSYNPHSNCRAELAVKAGKKLLRDNTGPGGSLDNDRFMRAVMQFRNTPMQDCRRSPAQMVFGRQMREFIPSMVHKYEPAKDWSVTQEYRERTLAIKRESDDRRWSQRTKDLDDLVPGTAVSIQNQTGNNPTKWDKTGIVLENKPHSQVMIRVDGSRRVTTRNRRFVRPLNPTLRKESSRPTPRKEDSRPKPRREETQDPIQYQHAQDAAAVEHDQVPEVNHEDRGVARQVDEDVHHDDPDQSVHVHGAGDDGAGETQDLQEDDPGAGPDTVAITNTPTPLQLRPRRSSKPNPKYSPEVYDLSYVGKRSKSRKSIRRAGN